MIQDTETGLTAALGSPATANATTPLIDHPATQPLEYQPHRSPSPSASARSGLYLRFRTRQAPRPGTRLLLTIPAAGEIHRFHSQVIEVDRSTSPNRVVVWIGAKREAFAARMVEQLCHIAHYRLLTAANEGRALSAERAADEWIGRFAAHFPVLHS